MTEPPIPYVKVIVCGDSKEFEEQADKLFTDGYRMQSSSSAAHESGQFVFIGMFVYHRYHGVL